jgi:quercetin dioxygenase-like cupin family protein
MDALRMAAPLLMDTKLITTNAQVDSSGDVLAIGTEFDPEEDLQGIKWRIVGWCIFKGTKHHQRRNHPYISSNSGYTAGTLRPSSRLLTTAMSAAGTMPRLYALASSFVVIASIAAFAQYPQLAPEGRGLLHKPAEVPATLGGAPPPHPFLLDPSGGFSRTIFETDENPNFELVIQDFSFPPGRLPHTLTLPSGAFLHLLSGEGEVSIANQRVVLSARSRTAVPPGASIAVVNNGDYPVLVRALIVKAK